MPRYLPAVLALAAALVLALVSRGSSSTSHPAAGHTSAVSAPNPTAASPVGASAASTPRSAPARHHRHHHGSRSCETSLWQHVYHPDRLQAVGQCKTITGTVTEVRQEPDGDMDSQPHDFYEQAQAYQAIEGILADWSR